MTNKHFAILVGGGPAPGINAVISSATIEAINRGYRVLGITNGFKDLIEGKTSGTRELTIADVSGVYAQGGSILRTSRTNPTKSPELVANVVRALNELQIGYLITIGGDDTATSAEAIARASKNSIAVAHVPKTIDNDLPIPDKSSTFGFQTAREVGTEITKILMEDARSTSRWYVVIAMGRKAGHLALGIGISSGATLTIIPEEFSGRSITLGTIVDIIVGSIIKRLAVNRPYGVVVLAEGLAEQVDVNSIPEIQNVERDPHGHVRFAELDFGGIVKRAVRERLKSLGVDVKILDKDIGYELRCPNPNSFDREYTRVLGYGAVDFLLSGGSGAMITRQGDELKPIPFAQLMDPATKKVAVRMVDTSSTTYRVARQYMIRLSPEDLQGEAVKKIAAMTNMPAEKFAKEFNDTAKNFGL